MHTNSPAQHPQPAPILLVYASHFGQAQHISLVVAEQLRQHGLRTHCMALPANQTVTAIPGHWRAVLWIASVRYGRFAKSLSPMIQAQQKAAPHTPWGFASVSLTARKPDKRSPQSHRNTQQLLTPLQAAGLLPQWAAVFPGALRYPRYAWLDKQMIRLIMHITGGVTDTRCDIEYTDWDAVRAWADQIAASLQTDSQAPLQTP